jgi:hypothetical protein
VGRGKKPLIVDGQKLKEKIPFGKQFSCKMGLG